jgi:hypothetical protein
MSGMLTRLLKNSEPAPEQNENGCWIWTGSQNNAQYGRYPYRVVVDTVDEWGEPVRVNKVRHQLAHRAMVMVQRQQDEQLAADLAADGLFLGPPVPVRQMDPDEETVEHLCACRQCINPDHMIVVTRAKKRSLMQERRKAT